MTLGLTRFRQYVSMCCQDNICKTSSVEKLSSPEHTMIFITVIRDRKENPNYRMELVAYVCKDIVNLIIWHLYQNKSPTPMMYQIILEPKSKADIIYPFEQVSFWENNTEENEYYSE